jgi:hypothetical protein
MINLSTHIALPSFNIGFDDLTASNTSYVKLDTTETTVQEILEELERSSKASGAKIYYDTKENWQKQTSLVSEKGSIYVYSDQYLDNDTPIPALKVGDGLAYVVDLPFADKIFYEHIMNNSIHLSEQDRWKLENSVCAEMSQVDNENLTLFN